MPNNDQQNWHRSDKPDNGDLTVRHSGAHFQTIRAWAEHNGITEIFEAIALTFGFTENFTIIGNLYRELSNPDSTAILDQWAENPYTHQLKRFRLAYNQSTELSIAYAGIHQGVSRGNTKSILRAAGADIKNEHFLLEMIVQPLALSGPNSLDRLRRTLRIWLIVQALERTVEHGCHHDSQIQQVASALCLSGESHKWSIIDAVLETSLQTCPTDDYSYSLFTLAIRHAATQLIARYSGADTRKQLLLLKAIQRVAEGQCNPTGVRRTEYVFQPSFTNLLKATAPSFNLNSETGEPQLLAFPENDFESADEEALDQLLLFDVDPEETPEQQRLSGRSILMQTAELSHYLPWSWEKPLPPEIQKLEQWLTRTLSDDSPAEKLGAALVWLAIHFGRSLEFIQELEITDTPQAEWSISCDFLTAHRQPPRRHNSWYPDEEAQSLIEPFDDFLRIALPEQIHISLRETAETYQDISTLRQLWARACPHALTTWFRQHAKQNFPRLSSAKLANAQSQRVFDELGDHSLARLLSAHPRAALPAACGYANWSINQVQNGFALPLQHTISGAERLNLLGSLLAPLESVLVDGIRKGTQKLIKSASDDPIIFHNNLVQYIVTALYAATGCRHLSEPFESLSHFCDQPAVVFINDKSDDGLHCGRMVPLANGAQTLLNSYCEHLRALQDNVAHHHRNLAHRIEQVLQGTSKTLPLFFFLDYQGSWHPLNDLDVPGADLFSWPLPKNLFRHRFSQQLARIGVNPEVIDGWMGHGERGAASYSDHSARCWRDDYDRYTEAVNQCFDQLGFLVSVPETLRSTVTFQIRPDGDHYREPESFGQARRHAERCKARDQARSVARKDLDLVLKSSPVTEKTELTQAYVDDLVKRMILLENGLPHPHATVRMEVLIQWLEDNKSPARQFIRHRMTRLETERSLFRTSCPLALHTMPVLQRWTQTTRQGIRQARLSKSNGLALAAAFLAIEKRISYLGLLEDLVQGQNYRVVQHKQHVYLEYNESLEPDNYDQPVQRHQIDHTTGRLLARGLGIKDTKDLNKTPCPKPLQSLANTLKATGHLHNEDRAELSIAELLKSLHRLVEQANLVDLPGVVAGALSERNPPTSLCLYDYYRLSQGLRYKPPEKDTEGPLAEADSLPIIPAIASENYPDSFYDSTKVFFRTLQDILNRYTKGRSLDIAKGIEQHCRSNAHCVSSAVLLLGYWIAHRIRKGKGRVNRAHKPYAANSVKRYLSALSAAFRGFAFKADLMLMTDEDVTELCAQMISQHAENQRDLNYFSARLLDFFDWASERGVSTPDWDELDLGSSRRSVRPRLFSEDEYLQAIRVLLRPDTEDIERGMQAAFVLLLAFRFGLRAQEAIGLLRSDWCESGGMVWVLVQGNTVRSLKNNAHSRRAVPLLFRLMEIERTLVETTLTRYSTRLGNIHNKPLLANKDGSLTPFAQWIPSDIARALRLVTGSPRMSLHQARHGFCNILTCALFNIDTPLANKLTASLDKESLRKTTLGDHELPSRRGTMAIARALGHQSPRTQLRSYNHVLTEWADVLTPISSHYSSTISEAIHIDQWPLKLPAEPEQEPTIFAKQVELTPLKVIESLRLMALGYSTPRIEHLLRLNPGELADVESLVDRINASLRFKAYNPEQMKKAYVYGRALPKYLLKSRSAKVWPRLLRLSEDLPASSELSYDRPLPSLDQASNLVGRNGHLMMNKMEESHLLRLMVDAFKLPESAYEVVVKSKPEDIFRARELVLGGDFLPTDRSIQLDTFNEDYDTAYTRARSYAGLVLTKPVIGQIHDRLELVLVFIAVAAAYCPRTVPLSPLPVTHTCH